MAFIDKTYLPKRELANWEDILLDLGVCTIPYICGLKDNEYVYLHVPLTELLYPNLLEDKAIEELKKSNSEEFPIWNTSLYEDFYILGNQNLPNCIREAMEEVTDLTYVPKHIQSIIKVGKKYKHIKKYSYITLEFVDAEHHYHIPVTFIGKKVMVAKEFHYGVDNPLDDKHNWCPVIEKEFFSKKALIRFLNNLEIIADTKVVPEVTFWYDDGEWMYPTTIIG